MEPYYTFPPPPDQPAYIEFRIGDSGDELGIIDRKYGPAGASNPPGGAVMYWHVDDLDATVKKRAVTPASPAPRLSTPSATSWALCTIPTISR
jgi:hypothetical protein